MSGLPTGWAAATLEDLVCHRGEKRSPQDMVDAPYVGLEHVEPHTGQLLGHARAGDLRSAGAVFSKGDLLYSRLRPYLNKVWVADRDGIASAEFLVLRATESAWLEFVRRRIMSSEFLDFTAGLDKGDRPRVDFKRIKAFPVMLPPYGEQKRISSKLDVLTARTTRARGELDLVPALAAQYRKAILGAAFRGHLTRTWRDGDARCDEAERDGTTLFALPESWRWEAAASVVEPGASIIYGIIQPGPKLTEGVPYVRGTDIQGGKILVHQLLRTSPEIAARYERSKLMPGDVILGIIRATKVAVVPEELSGANITQGTARFRPGSSITTGYLALWLEGPDAQEWLHAHYRGIDMPGLNLSDVRRLPVPIPPKAEQEEIVRIVRSAFAEIDRLAAEAAAARRLVDRLDQAILTKAFRGELVPQHPADEPASVLLERIRAARAAAPKAKPGRIARAAA